MQGFSTQLEKNCDLVASSFCPFALLLQNRAVINPPCQTNEPAAELY